ncbi:hypothetical protein EVAR_84362_1 [Eumeta japonica]|uniref:Uncharacterized protein n=1 Tax=Eumeta variegata TaxID=151549 RepID=A0A4C1U543_EUMVA|nr:hypothetical protein EVAR_84362_1 [Eumeta japonica]
MTNEPVRARRHSEMADLLRDHSALYILAQIPWGFLFMDSLRGSAAAAIFCYVSSGDSARRASRAAPTPGGYRRTPAAGRGLSSRFLSSPSMLLPMTLDLGSVANHAVATWLAAAFLM